MTMNPYFDINFNRPIAAADILSVVQSFMEAGFKPSLGEGVFYTDSDIDNKIVLDKDWGPIEALQKAYLQTASGDFGLDLCIDFEKKSMLVVVHFRKQQIELMQGNDIPKIGHTRFADINPLIIATHDALLKALGPYEIDANFSDD
jgi:hypothetical protein